MRTAHVSKRLLQRNEAAAVSGTNTGTAVLNWVVGDRELTQIVTNHLRLVQR